MNHSLISPAEINAGVRFNVPLTAFNTFGIAATAHAYLALRQASDLRVLQHSRELADLPQLVLGGGSNLVLRGDFPGLVLHMRGRGIEICGEDERFVYVRAQAGQTWHELVLWTLARGLGGLENLSLIPGTVGAAPIQNIGAYGVELKDRFWQATVFNRASGEIQIWQRDDCAFAYRDSAFKHPAQRDALILDVGFALPKNWQPELGYAQLQHFLREQGLHEPTPQQISQAVITIRQQKLPDPARLGNAGSFFKNPVVAKAQRDELLREFPKLVSYAQADGSFKLAAGWLIEQAGWKGKSLGRAGVYSEQALVLVNLGGATGAEIIALAQQIQADVRQKFGVQLEPEPVFV